MVLKDLSAPPIGRESRRQAVSCLLESAAQIDAIILADTGLSG
jgi:hypothetical protein